jgi:hypothetical protein
LSFVKFMAYSGGSMTPPLPLVIPPVPPLVGREEEGLRLKELVVRVLGGEGHAVQLVGEAGVGKSRLLHEVRQELDRRRIPAFEGRATGGADIIGRRLSLRRPRSPEPRS